VKYDDEVILSVETVHHSFLREVGNLLLPNASVHWLMCTHGTGHHFDFHSRIFNLLSEVILSRQDGYLLFYRVRSGKMNTPDLSAGKPM